MFRDVSKITNLRTCTYITNDTTIVSTGDSVPTHSTDIFVLIGNRYELTTSDLNSTTTPPTGTICLTPTTILSLQTNYSPINTTVTTVDVSTVNETVKDVAIPFYHSMAILSALLIFYFAYKLILYPWFRKRS